MPEFKLSYTAKEIDERLKKAGEQPDWNAAEGEHGHVMNRTHYVSEGIVELPVVGSWEQDNDGKVFVLTAPIGLEIGKTYTVNWNGTEYERVAIDASSLMGEGMRGVMLGNFATFSPDEPFLIVELSVETAAMNDGIYGTVANFYGTEVPFSIRGEGEVVHKIDPKFLPDGVPYVEKSVGAISPESTYEVTSAEFYFAPIAELTVGETYTVNWNGTEYTCTATVLPPVFGFEGVFIGDMGAIQGAPTSGEPFVLITTIMDGVLYGVGVCIDESTSVTLSINGAIVKAKKLDNRCLPSGLAKMYDVHMIEHNNFATVEVGETFAEIYEKAVDASTIVRGRMSLNIDGSDPADLVCLQLSGVTTKVISFSTVTLDGTRLIVAVPAEGEPTITIKT